MQSKNELRQMVRQRKREFSRLQLKELSLAGNQRIITSQRYREASTIMLYTSLPDEVDTSLLLSHSLAEGKMVLLPKVTGETTMELRVYKKEQDLVEGAFHIMEPTGRSFTDYASIDLAVIPGMAFDTLGNRLGRGKGYYDRFLSLLPPYIYKIGVCFGFQMFDSIPSDTTDIRMNEVIQY